MAQVVTAGQMAEITTAIHALIVAIVLGVTGVAATYLYQWKVALPHQFKLRDEQRTAEIEAAKRDLKNKTDAEAVDIERERMLPRLFEATISMAQNINQSMLQNAQQTALYLAQLTAHDKQLTTNTDQLAGLVETVDIAITNIQLLEKKVDASADHGKAAAVYSDQAARAATETLELVRRELNKIVSAKKSDTGELPSLEHIQTTDPATADGAAADSTGSAAA